MRSIEVQTEPLKYSEEERSVELMENKGIELRYIISFPDHDIRGFCNLKLSHNGVKWPPINVALADALQKSNPSLGNVAFHFNLTASIAGAHKRFNPQETVESIFNFMRDNGYCSCTVARFYVSAIAIDNLTPDQLHPLSLKDYFCVEEMKTILTSSFDDLVAMSRKDRRYVVAIKSLQISTENKRKICFHGKDDRSLLEFNTLSRYWNNSTPSKRIDDISQLFSETSLDIPEPILTKPNSGGVVCMFIKEFGVRDLPLENNLFERIKEIDPNEEIVAACGLIHHAFETHNVSTYHLAIEFNPNKTNASKLLQGLNLDSSWSQVPIKIMAQFPSRENCENFLCAWGNDQPHSTATNLKPKYLITLTLKPALEISNSNLLLNRARALEGKMLSDDYNPDEGVNSITVSSNSLSNNDNSPLVAYLELAYSIPYERTSTFEKFVVADLKELNAKLGGTFLLNYRLKYSPWTCTYFLTLTIKTYPNNPTPLPDFTSLGIPDRKNSWDPNPVTRTFEFESEENRNKFITACENQFSSPENKPLKVALTCQLTLPPTFQMPIGDILTRQELVNRHGGNAIPTYENNSNKSMRLMVTAMDLNFNSNSTHQKVSESQNHGETNTSTQSPLSTTTTTAPLPQTTSSSTSTTTAPLPQTTSSVVAAPLPNLSTSSNASSNTPPVVNPSLKSSLSTPPPTTTLPVRSVTQLRQSFHSGVRPGGVRLIFDSNQDAAQLSIIETLVNIRGFDLPKDFIKFLTSEREMEISKRLNIQYPGYPIDMWPHYTQETKRALVKRYLVHLNEQAREEFAAAAFFF